MTTSTTTQAWLSELPEGYSLRTPKPLAPSTRSRWSRPWYFMLRDLWENGGYGWQPWGSGHMSSGITNALTSRKMIETAETPGRGSLLFRLTPKGYDKLLDLYEERAEAADRRGEPEYVDPVPPEGAPLKFDRYQQAAWRPKPAGYFKTFRAENTGRAYWVGCGHPAERDINDNCLVCHATLVVA